MRNFQMLATPCAMRRLTLSEEPISAGTREIVLVEVNLGEGAPVWGDGGYGGACRRIRHYVQPRRVHMVQPDLDTVGLTGGHRLPYWCARNGVRPIPHNRGTQLRTAGTVRRGYPN